MLMVLGGACALCCFLFPPERPSWQVQRMKHLCLLLADSALLDVQLQMWRPSVLAAGIIYTVRRILGFKHVVRAEIEAICGECLNSARLCTGVGLRVCCPVVWMLLLLTTCVGLRMLHACSTLVCFD
jgi:hypothetical protein